ncbi:Hemolysin-related protein [Thermotoga neapolitana DSM 4359]|uniref:Hemolysin-related protein n=1 Tax=Thermotoga neapolitana (strain ATCC 49049 / DSM 4359 / NBRC 107923 / NS-E) TaxID=309803 RepID=B9KAC3_THENN|nr:Hemolysin-related protein [Thermotoga neapolitana DSM 4359]
MEKITITDGGGTEVEDPVSSMLTLGLEGLLLVVLIYLSNFFSSSETALTLMSKVKIKEFLEKKEEESERESYIHLFNKYLTTILISNNLVNLFASSISTLIFLNLLRGVSEELVAVVSTLFITAVLLIFGEITPKVMARAEPDRIFQRSIGVVRFLTRVFDPVGRLLVKISDGIIALRHGKKISEDLFITEEDIVSIVQVGGEMGVIEQEEERIVKRAFEMKQIAVKEIMTPRVDIVAIEENQTVRDLIELIEDEGYSRIPVYRETIDNIVGVCYAKDVLSILAEKDCEEVKNMKVKDIMRDALYVPETMNIDELLKILKSKKIHIAIVVDEYGGTAGIVTLEDIIEELFGDIMDEYDYDEVSGIKKIGEKTYIVDGSTPINDLEIELRIQFPQTEYETIAGYLLEHFKRIPNVGEEAVIGNLYFKVLAVGKNRIEKIMIKVLEGGRDETGETGGNGSGGSGKGLR